MSTEDDHIPDPEEVHELSRDILRATEEYFLGVDKTTVVYALLALAADIVQAGTDCSPRDALLYIRAVTEEEIEKMGGIG